MAVLRMPKICGEVWTTERCFGARNVELVFCERLASFFFIGTHSAVIWSRMAPLLVPVISKISS